MKLKAQSYELRRDLQGNVEITFKISPESAWASLQIENEYDLKGELTLEIKKYHKARTIDQNSLLWAIETKLAEKLKLPTQEVHKQNVFDYGAKIGTVLMKTSDADRLIKSNDYARITRQELKNNVPCAYVELFLGSSQLDTKEFSVLVDGVLQECKNVGVNVDFEEREIYSIMENKK